MKNRTFIISIISIIVVFSILFIIGGTRKSSHNQASTNTLTALKQPFDAKATIKMKDLVLVADINKSAVGCATIKINEPKSLKDMVFKYDGKDINVSYKGLTVKLDENSKLVSSLVTIIVNSIDKAASDSGIDVETDGNAITVSGKSDSGRFVITLDKKNGSIASINLPELDFECNFNNFLAKG